MGQGFVESREGDVGWREGGKRGEKAKVSEQSRAAMHTREMAPIQRESSQAKKPKRSSTVRTCLTYKTCLLSFHCC